MSNEKLAFANELKERIDRLDYEIDKIRDVCPPVRSVCRTPHKLWRGNTRKIKNGRLIPKEGLNIEIELSNEDCRALMDIRTAEREALQSVLDSLS